MTRDKRESCDWRQDHVTAGEGGDGQGENFEKSWYKREREREKKCSLIPDRRNQTIIQGGALYQRSDKEGGLKKEKRSEDICRDSGGGGRR